MAPPTLRRLTGLYLRISNLTFGGGDPTMAILYNELVSRRAWLEPESYGLIYALARITPGTNMLAFIAGTAWRILGWRAAALAVAAATVPAATVVVLLTAGYDAVRANPRAMAAIGGTLAAGVGMMATGAWQLLAPQFAQWEWRRALRALALAGGGLVLSLNFAMPPIQVLGLAAVAGFFWQAPDES